MIKIKSTQIRIITRTNVFFFEKLTNENADLLWNAKYVPSVKKYQQLTYQKKNESKL